MSSVNPRASGLWSTSSRMSYVSVQQSDEGDDLDVEGLGFDAPDDFDGRTPLDRSIDRIGMGEHIPSLCGPARAHGNSSLCAQGATNGRSSASAVSVSRPMFFTRCSSPIYLRQAGWRTTYVCPAAVGRLFDQSSRCGYKQ